jgi:hypothetical protein
LAYEGTDYRSVEASHEQDVMEIDSTVEERRLGAA